MSEVRGYVLSRYLMVQHDVQVRRLTGESRNVCIEMQELMDGQGADALGEFTHCYLAQSSGFQESKSDNSLADHDHSLEKHQGHSVLHTALAITPPT